MTTIITLDRSGGDFLEEAPGNIFGSRLFRDRRYWLAWADVTRTTPGDCLPGVIDDFGAIVPVPWPPETIPQHRGNDHEP
ncbi:hypothetical protein D3C72_2384130 [compost metagenome]